MTYNIRTRECFGQEIGEDGPYTARFYGVECVDEVGHRWVHEIFFRQAESAENLAERIAIHISKNPSWKPGDRWNADQPVYGSDAYQLEGGEQYLARVDVEADRGPGTYLPGHPGFIG